MIVYVLWQKSVGEGYFIHLNIYVYLMSSSNMGAEFV